MMQRADCVIVGAGPAGSTTAVLLARQGFDVLLIDRAEFPRAKACGDCISPQANLLLAELGVLPDVERVAAARLDGWRIIAPNGCSFHAPFSASATDARLESGFALPRERLDDILLQAARNAGVRVQTGSRVDDLIFDNDRVAGARWRDAEVHAPLTIGADGLQSIIRRRLQLAARSPRLRKVALTAHVTAVKSVMAYGELHLLPGACVGLAPVNSERSLCNVTLVLNAETDGRSLTGKSVEAFRAHLERFPALRGRFDDASIEGSLLAAGPFDQPTRAVVVPGAALAGDAAGYFDPFTGQGIYQAIAGGMLLARAAAQALRAQRAHEPLRSYARQLYSLVVPARRVQRAIEVVCARPALANRCIQALAAAPAAANTLVAVTGDMIPARRLLSPRPMTSFLRQFSRTAA